MRLTCEEGYEFPIISRTEILGSDFVRLFSVLLDGYANSAGFED